MSGDIALTFHNTEEDVEACYSIHFNTETHMWHIVWLQQRPIVMVNSLQLLTFDQSQRRNVAASNTGVVHNMLPTSESVVKTLILRDAFEKLNIRR